MPAGDSSNVSSSPRRFPAGQRQDDHLGVAGVQRVLAAGDSSSSTLRLESPQPADSGVTSTVYGGVALRAGM
jgi:hypothetical protein